MSSNLRVELYLKPSKQQITEPITLNNCTCRGKERVLSTELIYSDIEQQTKDHFERLAKLGKLDLEIYDLNHFSAKIKGLRRGILKSGAAVYENGKFINSVSLEDAKQGYLTKNSNIKRKII
ncbi:MAG: hypothetical protein PHU12_02070 [Candidatus Aenigmarchaeota archaeon]|nr:hypothetical protein [Candidatus Aenigmarchaeota archaeon]